jgi:hypothetical protein
MKTKQLFPLLASRYGLVSLTLLALAGAVLSFTATRKVSAFAAGSIHTSYPDGRTVNGNIYDKCEDVYLNGGPQNLNGGGGLIPGDYYFQVTNPNGDILLSSDKAECRQVKVAANGSISGGTGPCPHPDGQFNPANNSLPVRLYPFNVTPNPGGEYKVWLISANAATIDPTDDKKLIFDRNSAKTDNFKCKERPGQDPDLAIGGIKFNDLNANGTFDAGETGVEGVTINVTLGDGTQLPPTQTDATGTWGVALPKGTKYTACEVLAAPFNTQTGPLSGSQALDQLNQLAATASSAKCWEGTVTGTDALTLNFYNATCTPQITCPADITKNNDSGQCSAKVDFSITGSDNCDATPQVSCVTGAGVVVSSGSSFPVGTTTVTCTLKDKFNNTAQCSFKVTVVDNEAPVLSLPSDQTVCAAGEGSCAAVVNFSASANDNCEGAVSVSCSTAGGPVVSGASFPLGTTTVTCTAADSKGNTASGSFKVTVNDCSKGSISGKKIYDKNGDNPGDGGGGGVKGFKIVLSGTQSATVYTDSNGNYAFTDLPAGSYTVTEVPPPPTSSSAWVATKATSFSFKVSCANVTNVFTNDFCNYCKVPSGGLSKGFWGNNNGKALITAADLCALTALPLRNANGSNFDPVAAGKCSPAITLTTAETNAGKNALDSWLQAANATNMANMLSAQLAATVLNVRSGKASGAAVTLCFNGTINDLIAAATASLAANPNTTASGATRTYQESLKNCSEGINTGALVILSPGPCPIPASY